MNYATKVDPRLFSADRREKVFSRKSKWIKACGAMLLWAATTIALPAQTITVLHSFDGTDGNAPQTGALVQGTDGNLYGTTERGGAGNDGTVYAITTGGSLTTVINFNGTDGANPFSGVVQSAYGGLYGTPILAAATPWERSTRLTLKRPPCCTALPLRMAVRRRVASSRAPTETSTVRP
jgi:uncharacterized repeat protein (TIGR03803 family)